ncbi:MAG: hypothetical protein JW891_06900 [Candidatus Lokiarchaeota archaeon]|nr:hypothetical protein [Candidatus Lokiarchaeota archaeon]
MTTRDNGYVLAILAGILALIALVAPFVFDDASVDTYLWVWTLYYWKSNSNSESGFFDNNADLTTWSMITTIIIVVAMLVLLVTGAKAKGKSNSTAIWVISGVLLIAAPIIYYISMMSVNLVVAEWWIYTVEVEFWEVFDPYFGFWISIFAGVLALVSGFV